MIEGAHPFLHSETDNTDSRNATEVEHRILESIADRTNKVLNRFERRYPRLSDIKWFIGLLTFVFLGIIGLAQWNLRDDKKALTDEVSALRISLQTSLEKARSDMRAEWKSDLERERRDRDRFQNDLMAQWRATSLDSNLVLYYNNNGKLVLLNNQEVPVDIDKLWNNDDHKYTWVAHFHYIIKNESKVATNTFVVQSYLNDPRMGSSPSADLNYKYEDEPVVSGVTAKQIPGGYIATVNYQVWLIGKSAPSISSSVVLHKVPLLIKIYYGNGKSVSANIYMTGRSNGNVPEKEVPNGRRKR